jgi:hypothetical protein
MGMRAGDCKHYNGIMQPGVSDGEEVCKAGVNYVQLAGGRDGMYLRLPCHQTDFRGGPKDRKGEKEVPCPKFEAVTPAEEAADRVRRDEDMKTLAAGLSICCKAPLDRSHLLQSGRWKGNGWVYCSSCKRPVMHVCART